MARYKHIDAAGATAQTRRAPSTATAPGDTLQMLWRGHENYSYPHQNIHQAITDIRVK